MTVKSDLIFVAYLLIIALLVSLVLWARYNGVIFEDGSFVLKGCLPLNPCW